MKRGGTKYPWLVAVVGVCMVALIAGCNSFEEESQEQQQQSRQQKLQEEPTLSLYVVETEEKTDVNIEEYVAGVVAGEMEADWPESAYAAQAILARSFTMDWLDAGKKSRHGTDLSTDIEEAQAYKPDAVTDTIRKAVDRTRGEVMTYNGDYVKAWFHSYSGGRTATAKEGLDYPEAEPGWIKSIKLPENPHVPDELKSWLAVFDEGKVAQTLQKLGKDVGEIRRVEIGQEGPSGRAMTLVFVGSAGKEEVSGPEFRIAVGSKELKSLLISDVSWSDGKLKISGSGFGHGVGLSQWDAYMLAENGDSPEDIVKRFFPNVTIEQRWN